MKRNSKMINVIILCCMIGMLIVGCDEKTKEKVENVDETTTTESVSINDSELASGEVDAEKDSEEPIDEGVAEKDSEEISDESNTENDTEESTTESVQQDNQTYVYIGTTSAGFKEYPVSIEGDVTGDQLIAAIEDLTGWNLALSDSVISGKGGVAVSFSPECSLVTGPPEEQKEEFFVYDNYHLAQMILDSIQETLRNNFVMEPGDPTTLDIWYSMEDQPIEVEGVTILIEKPWDEQKPFN